MLSVRDHMLLTIESRHWTRIAAKEGHAREVLGYSATRYAQVLNSLLDRPEAEAAYPQLVHRLQRLRDVRRQGRKAA